jgi:hypothetical protein
VNVSDKISFHFLVRVSQKSSQLRTKDN